MAWVMAYDIEPLVTIKEKIKLLDLVQKNNWKIFFELDLNLEACSIKKTNNNFILDEAIKINE